MVARGANPKNPGQWYLENVAGVRRMAHETFAPEGDVLFQRMAAEQGGWHFPLQRALEDMGDVQMQFGQFAKALQKRGISNEEIATRVSLRPSPPTRRRSRLRSCCSST